MVPVKSKVTGKGEVAPVAVAGTLMAASGMAVVRAPLVLKFSVAIGPAPIWVPSLAAYTSQAPDGRFT